MTTQERTMSKNYTLSILVNKTPNELPYNGKRLCNCVSVRFNNRMRDYNVYCLIDDNGNDTENFYTDSTSGPLTYHEALNDIFRTVLGQVEDALDMFDNGKNQAPPETNKTQA